MSKATRVECYSGTRYAERPRSFSVHGSVHNVKAVEKSWRTPSGLHFLVVTEDDESFELVYDARADKWNIVKGGKL